MANDTLLSLVPLILGFVAYFALHSLLASLRFKRWVHHRWPQIMHAYRVAYNFLAITLLIPLLWFMRQAPGPLVWQWPESLTWLSNGLTAAAVLGFLWSLKSYDNMVFLGISQWRNRHKAAQDPGSLHISTLHRFVRHPWYFFFLVIMWAQDLHLVQVLVYGLITLYFVIGSRLEERKLIAQYGKVYEDYRRQVPGLIPLPWKWLRKTEARRLEQRAREMMHAGGE
ncbi:MAG TPA: isoprenylcysteine carboxylmethyltransferase family protein [Gammaproteobacteria bacterium]|nr:isoprenylcysteine carboxylmethyltransferase family protein [Gammaproteobacteria bacterium]